MRRRIGEPCECRLPHELSPVSAWASKCTMPTLPGACAAATAVAAGHVIEWSPPITMGVMFRVATSPNSVPDGCVRDLRHTRHASRVSIVDDSQLLERGNLEFDMPLGALIRRRPDGPGTEARAGPVGDPVVPRSADDGDIRPHLVELLDAAQKGNPAEGRRAEVRGPVVEPFHRAKTTVSAGDTRRRAAGDDRKARSRTLRRCMSSLSVTEQSEREAH